MQGCSLYEGEAAMTGAVEAPGGWLVACNYQPMAQYRRCNRVTKSTGLVSISAMLSADLQAIILIHPDGFDGE
jgi:glycine cleavage system aminomethyltransferase T